MKMSITAHRVNNGLSQSDVAKKFGVTVQTVSHWENGSCLTIANLVRLCDLYKCELDDVDLTNFLTKKSRVSKAVVK